MLSATGKIIYNTEYEFYFQKREDQHSLTLHATHLLHGPKRLTIGNKLLKDMTRWLFKFLAKKRQYFRVLAYSKDDLTQESISKQRVLCFGRCHQLITTLSE